MSTLRYRDAGNIIRYVADTAANRAKYAGRILPGVPKTRGRVATPARAPKGSGRAGRSSGSDSGRPLPSPSSPAQPLTRAESAGQGDAAAQAAVAGMGGPSVAASGAAPAAPKISYESAVTIMNMIMSAQVPDVAMTEDEQKQIGVALDAVIEKRWPWLKDAGPETALFLAVAGWFARAIFPLIMERVKTGRLSAAPSGPDVRPLPVEQSGDVDPYAHGRATL